MRRMLGCALIVCALSVTLRADGNSSQTGKSCDPATQVCTASTNPQTGPSAQTSPSVAETVLAEVTAFLASLGIVK